jgi:SAM-dependent methyltransferase
MLERRREIAQRYLHGAGIEIGALIYPTLLKIESRVIYVDRLPVSELVKQYPNLIDENLKVDVVDNGEILATFEAESVDFVIANHMIEHCQNPIGAIRNHLRILRPNGILFYAIPDKKHCFDRHRPNTSFEHLLADDKDNGKNSKWDHYIEWATLVNSIEDTDKAISNAKENIRLDYSIHFHVWDAGSCIEFFSKTASHLSDAYKIELFERNNTEFILCLQKNH